MNWWQVILGVVAAIVLWRFWQRQRDSNAELTPEAVAEAFLASYAAPDSPTERGDYCAGLLAYHVEKVAKADHAMGSALRTFLPPPVLAAVGEVVAEKQAATTVDRLEHSTTLEINRPTIGRFILYVNTIPSDNHTAAGWYQEEYGGFRRFLSKAMQTLRPDVLVTVTFTDDGVTTGMFASDSWRHRVPTIIPMPLVNPTDFT